MNACIYRVLHLNRQEEQVVDNELRPDQAIKVKRIISSVSTVSAG